MKRLWSKNYTNAQCISMCVRGLPWAYWNISYALVRADDAIDLCRWMIVKHPRFLGAPGFEKSRRTLSRMHDVKEVHIFGMWRMSGIMEGPRLLRWILDEHRKGDNPFAKELKEVRERARRASIKPVSEIPE